MHAYVLLHFAMLARKVGAFDKELREQLRDRPDLRTQLRGQLPSNIFVQFLAGPREERNGIMGFLLWLIALISLVVGPICLLIFFELQFLPYHNVWIAWWQRIAVGIDLLLMWAFWGRIALGRNIAPDKDTLLNRIVACVQRWATYAIMAVLTLGSAVLLLIIATFPGEKLEAVFAAVGDYPGHAWLNAQRVALVAGDVRPASRQPESLWSNRLVLPGLDVVVHLKLDSDAKIDFLPETVSLRDRDLRGAVLIGAVLRKADFTGADLRDVKLDGANLRQAKMACAYWADMGQRHKDGKPSDPECARLQGASLFGAQLQGASLNEAKLKGASLRSVFVWRADSRTANTANAWIEPVEEYRSVTCNEPKECPWTADTFKQLKNLLTETIPEGQARKAALKRIDPTLNPAPPPYPNEDAIAARWNKANTPHTPQNEQEAEIAGHWKSTGCKAGFALHVVTALARRMNTRDNFFTADSPFAENSPRAAQLAADFLHPSCAGNKGLSDADTAILIKIRDESDPPLTPPPNSPNSAPTNARGTAK